MLFGSNMSFSSEHPDRTAMPIVSTIDKSNDFNEEQFRKARSPMVFTDVGRSILSKALQPENTCSPIFSH